MSSTDDLRLRRFFRKHLLPAAAKLRARGVSFFPLGPEPEAETWYEGPPTEPKFTSLNVDECEAALRELWQNQDRPELAELAGELMKLAEHLEIHEEESADVSPFVYVMY
ncbi:MAG: hypothetical protein ABGY41_05275 [Candidatus Poribacteria bacterium]